MRLGGIVTRSHKDLGGPEICEGLGLGDVMMWRKCNITQKKLGARRVQVGTYACFPAYNYLYSHGSGGNQCSQCNRCKRLNRCKQFKQSNRCQPFVMQARIPKNWQICVYIYYRERERDRDMCMTCRRIHMLWWVTITLLWSYLKHPQAKAEVDLSFPEFKTWLSLKPAIRDKVVENPRDRWWIMKHQSWIMNHGSIKGFPSIWGYRLNYLEPPKCLERICRNSRQTNFDIQQPTAFAWNLLVLELLWLPSGCQ